MANPYVALPNRLIGQGPYLHRDVIFHGFTVDGDRAKLQLLLDQMFEQPSGGKVKFTCISKRVMISFANIGKVSSVSEPNSGWLPEIDVAMWVLAVAHELTPNPLRWIPVFLFVDSAAAMAAGREVYGFPKQLGWFEIANTGGAMQRFSAETIVFEKFDAQQKAEQKPVIEIEPIQPPPAGAIETIWNTASEAADGLLEVALPVAERALLPALKFSTRGLMPPVTMAFLKQFPEVSNTSRACHQSITKCDARVVAFRRAGRSKGEFRARISSYASHRFDLALGIAPGWHDVGKSTWLDYDFQADMGQELWRA